MFYFCCVKCPKLRLFCVSKDRVPRTLENGHGTTCYMENWPKVLEFCYQSWNFALKLYRFCMFFATTKSKKLSISLESPHERDGHGKLRNRVIVMEKCCQVCGNTEGHFLSNPDTYS